MRWDRAAVVVGAYTALAMLMTWPLIAGLGTYIAWDLGDPVFNCWVMLWTGGQVLKALHGDVNAIHDYWNGNIFYPERLTIAYSEHFTPQMLQTLPIFAATGNIVLCYNLLYLSTIVLSGYGMYLLVRELTGRPLAAFVAGLAFAFAPYRISQGPHLQELSCQWMPFVLYGFRRYFVSLRTRPLIGGSAALLVQNLSCGYYLLFFAPFAGLYCLYEMANRRLLRNARVWMSLAAAAIVVFALTWPFLSPYVKLRHQRDIGVRTYREAVEFSADVYALGTASSKSQFEGTTIRAFPRGEGEAFPGFAILALAGAAVVWGTGRAWATRRPSSPTDQASPHGPPVWQKVLGGVVCVGLVLAFVAVGVFFVLGEVPILSRARAFQSVAPLLIATVVLGAMAIALVPSARALARSLAGTTMGFYAPATIVATLLAFGPRITLAGQAIGTGPYYWLMTLVPGFDGIRVPARYFMVVACFLAVLAGLGAAELLTRWSRRGVILVGVAAFVILAESWVVPIETNTRLIVPGFEFTPRDLFTARTMSPIYQIVRDMPNAVLIEFPFGEPGYDILATYYAGFHRRPLVNGYSGFFPESYLRRATFLNHIPFDLETAYKAVVSSGATHAVVHEGAFPDGRGHEITDWLVANGGQVIATYGSDKLIGLR